MTHETVTVKQSKMRLTGLLFCAAFGASIALLQPAQAAKNYTLTGKVVQIADGDTLTVLDASKAQHKVRLANIDTPETGKGKKRPGQPFSNNAKDALEQWVAGKTIELTCFEQDRYERNICQIGLTQINGQPGTVNEALVAQGMAWAYTGSNGRYLRDKRLIDVQSDAQRNQRGLWAQPSPVPPWEWRQRCWKDGYCN